MTAAVCSHCGSELLPMAHGDGLVCIWDCEERLQGGLDLSPGARLTMDRADTVGQHTTATSAEAPSMIEDMASVETLMLREVMARIAAIAEDNHPSVTPDTRLAAIDALAQAAMIGSLAARRRLSS